MMTDFTDDPQFCRDLLHYCADVAMSVCRCQIADGADTIGMSDAAAGLLGPVLYKNFIVAEQMRVFKYIKEKHPVVITRQHMCGRITKLAEDFATLPVDIYEIDFPSDLAKIKAVLGDRVLSGNISTISDMFEGTAERVYDAVARCHAICGKRYIVNCGCEVPPGARLKMYGPGPLCQGALIGSDTRARPAD